jgi:phage tail sheath protein FI
MSVPVSYPGVYIQEVPSGVHAITGVSTSVALFVGRTKRGGLNVPTLRQSRTID